MNGGSRECGAGQELSRVDPFPTPTGLCNKAQDCEGRATLGTGSWNRLNPERVVSQFVSVRNAATQRHNPFRVAALLATISQGSSFLATLGFEAESLWDSSSLPRSKNAFRVRFRTLPSS